jgi:hypothetical protein
VISGATRSDDRKSLDMRLAMSGSGMAVVDCGQVRVCSGEADGFFLGRPRPRLTD